MKVEHCIIGGGIAGLTAAYKLGKSGQTVVLLEAARLGGLVKSIQLEGFTIEQGAGTLSASPALLQLCEQLGITDQLIYPSISSYRQLIEYKKQVHQLPKGPVQLFKSKLFNFKEKLKLLSGVFRTFPNSSFQEGLSIAEFISAIFCQSAADRLVAPAMRGIFGGDIYQLKAALVFPKLFQGLNSGYSLFNIMRGNLPNLPKRGSICCFKGGNEVLCKALLAKMPSTVSLITDRTQAVISEASYNFQVRLASGSNIACSKIYIATAGLASAEYLRSLHPLGKNLASLNYAAIKVIHIAIPKPNKLPANTFGLLFPKSSNSNLLGLLFNSKIFAHVAPDNFDLVTACFGGVNITAEQIDNPLEQLNKVLSFYFDISNFKVLAEHFWSHAIPQYDQACQDLLVLQADLSNRFPGLYFIGADTGGVGVPARIELVGNLLG